MTTHYIDNMKNTYVPSYVFQSEWGFPLLENYMIEFKMH